MLRHIKNENNFNKMFLNCVLFLGVRRTLLLHFIKLDLPSDIRPSKSLQYEQCLLYNLFCRYGVQCFKATSTNKFTDMHEVFKTQ